MHQFDPTKLATAGNLIAHFQSVHASISQRHPVNKKNRLAIRKDAEALNEAARLIRYWVVRSEVEKQNAEAMKSEVM